MYFMNISSKLSTTSTGDGIIGKATTVDTKNQPAKNKTKAKI